MRLARGRKFSLLTNFLLFFFCIFNKYSYLCHYKKVVTQNM